MSFHVLLHENVLDKRVAEPHFLKFSSAADILSAVRDSLRTLTCLMSSLVYIFWNNCHTPLPLLSLVNINLSKFPFEILNSGKCSFLV